MLWNPQFEIAALMLSVVFLFFYRQQKYIPMMSNNIYNMLLHANIILIVIDLYASYITSYYWKNPVWLLQLSNMLYFFFLFVIFHLFDVYVRLIADERRGKLHRWKFINIPLYMVSMLLLTNPWSSIFFQVDQLGGFKRSAGYYIFIAPYMLYHLIAVHVVLARNGKWIGRTEKFSLYFYDVVVFLGVFLQSYVFPYYLLVNASFAIGGGVVFLSMQNPEYDIDSRTRVYNQSCFQRYLNELILEETRITCLGVGIAGYRNIKSIYGEKKTEHLLKEIGAFLKTLSINSYPFYLGGGRFCILMSERTNKIMIKRKIEERFSRNWHLSADENEEISVETRFVFLPEESVCLNASDILDILRVEITEAQNSEQNKFRSIDFSDIKRRRREREIVRALHESIEKGNIRAYYQPIYDVESARPTYAEALIRIDDSLLGILEPGKFISLAEEDGTILRLGELIYREVCKFIRDNDIEELGIGYININLSPYQCLHEGLAEELISIAEYYGIDMSKLHFEITETAMIDLNDLRELMNKLIERGSSFSLDDYGTGYSNLISVIGLPLDVIKIDKSVVWSYFRDKNHLLPHLIKMFKEDGFDVLCEGIEDVEMKEAVEEMGAKYEQGYYYSRPLSEKDFISYMKSI